MNICKIIESGLESNGFDGLFVSGVCGCVKGELSPGNCLGDECIAGYKHTHSVTGDWIISEEKDGITDDEIQQCIDQCT